MQKKLRQYWKQSKRNVIFYVLFDNAVDFSDIIA
jgi:hypothetical protein